MANASRHWTRRRPLWAQILGLTIFVLLLPLVGFLLLNRFGRDLIEAEAAAVEAEAGAIALALEISAIRLDEANRVVLDALRARELLLAVASSRSPNSRIRLFDSRGRLLLDSDREIDGQLGGLGKGGLLISPSENFGRSFVPTLSDYPIYYEVGYDDERIYAEIHQALNINALFSGVYADPNAGRFRVLGAAQVSSAIAVLGAVLVDHDDTGIEQALNDLNQRIFWIFLIAFVITILVSLLLAWLIATPVTRLSRAARRLAAKEILPADLPTFPRRHDEIGDLALSLRVMARALIERADASDAFAAEVAHELKNPLTSLRSAAETLPLIKDSEKQARLLAVLAEDTDRLDRLISDISSSSRLDAELAREDPGRADLVATIVKFLEGQRLVDPEGLGGVFFDAGGLDFAPVRATESRLIQVVQNLLSNALSFCPDPAHVHLRLRMPRIGWVQMTVTDQGPGIPADKLDVIFRRFFTDRSESFGKHSGLGLSIVQRIVMAAGGSITAENRDYGSVGQTGARFIVELPLTRM